MKKVLILTLVLLFVLSGCSSVATTMTASTAITSVAPTSSATTAIPTTTAATPNTTAVTTTTTIQAATSETTLLFAPVLPTEPIEKNAEIKIIGAVRTKSIVDKKDLLIVEYEFTNTTNKTISFSQIGDQAFQNGVECEHAIYSDDIDFGELITDVKPEATHVCKNGYYLRDTKAVVKIEITSIYDEIIFQQSISIN